MIPITRVDDYGRPRTAPELVNALAVVGAADDDREPDDAPELDDLPDRPEDDDPWEDDGDSEPDDPGEDDDPLEPTYRY